MKKMALIFLAVAFLVSSCTLHSGPVSTVAKKDLRNYQVVGKGMGKQCLGAVIGLIPVGPKDIVGLAVDKACRDGGGDALLDATLTTESGLYYVYTTQCVTVEGTVGKRR